MLAVCYYLDTASEETGLSLWGQEKTASRARPASAVPQLAAPAWEAQHQRGAPQSVGCYGVPGASQAASTSCAVEFAHPSHSQREGGREGGKAWEHPGVQQPVICTETFETFLSIKRRALYNLSTPRETLDFCFRFPIAVTCADVSASGEKQADTCAVNN